MQYCEGKDSLLRKSAMTGTIAALCSIVLVVGCAAEDDAANPSNASQSGDVEINQVSAPDAPAPASEDVLPTQEPGPGPEETETVETTAELPTAPADTMIVLDSSGSMWGQIEGQAKRDIARQALRDMLPALSPDGNIGLVAYGHRREGDCGDIEVLLNAEPGARDRLIAAADGLNSLGKTPLTDAVRAAADTLSIADNPARVILVTDGLETCDADPCALGRELEQQGVDFTAHVIGFGLTQAEGRQVACLADETGGLYVEARNAEGLEDAFEVVADSETLPIEENTAPASVDASDDPVAVTAVFEVIWSGPQNGLDSLVVRSLDGETRFARTYIYLEEHESPATIAAPEIPGTYAVHYETRQGRSLAMDEFTVVEADASVTAPTDPIVAGTNFEISFIGPENEFDRIQVFTEASEERGLSGLFASQADGGTLSLVAPASPGKYFIRYLLHEGRAIAEAPITVISPQAFITPPQTAVVAGAHFPTQVSDNPGQADQVIIVDPANARKPIDAGYIQFATDGSVKLLAPLQPGTYEMQYIDGAEAVLASGELMVVAADTSITIIDPPIKVGEDFEIGVNPRHGEFDKLVLVSENDVSEEIASNYLNSARDGKLKFFSPISEAGAYVIQYQGREGEVLASHPFEAIAN